MFQKIKLTGINLLLLSSLFFGCHSSKEEPKFLLWYQQPATEWMQALPLGNGRLGAMVYGGIENEKIALNEITLWSGQVDENQEQEVGKEKLNEIRKLFFEGNLSEGNKKATQYLSGTPHSFGTHLPMGDLNINFHYPSGNVKNYIRQLDLHQAVASVSFDIDNVHYVREYFCSNPDDVFIIRMTANEKKSLSAGISLELLREAEINVADNYMGFSGQALFPKQGPGGVKFAGKISLKTEDGAIEIAENKLCINQATSITLTVDIRTDYKNDLYRNQNKETIAKALEKEYKELKEAHIKDHSRLFNRVDLFLGSSENSELPTDERWARVKNGEDDPELDALFVQYARYLLIASSRENSPLPANLQGIWNDNLANNMGWTCDYHLDINTQQNYWMSNVGNLHECNAPLFNYIEDLSLHGQKTARNVYGARGWTAHTVANVWGYTAPGQGVGWGLFPTAGTWMATHFWEHYLFTKDTLFLREKAYPIMKSNALFLLDYMCEHPHNGFLMTGPSTSPENSFLYEGKEFALSMMPECDRQLVHELFTSLISASTVLAVDEAFRNELEQALAKLPPMKIGRNGGIQEWFEDYEEAHPNHRHTTHLLALYPFAQLTPEKTPELAKAAETTLYNRLNADGWEDVEWSRANMICYFARLKKAQQAYESLKLMYKNFIRENLLTISPEGIAGAPYDIFIFDGNEAAGAGIAEMLIQSHNDCIQFLPALPDQWRTGYFKGLCVRGGGVVDLEWKDKKITIATIKATADHNFKMQLNDDIFQPKFTKNGKSVSLETNGDNLIAVDLKAGEVLEIRL